MARSEARILVEIWDDGDFLDLSPMAQRLYLFLISQRDLEHTGVIGLRERRWAKAAKGLSAGDVVAALGELEYARFVVVDEDAEEVLVRSFIRRDKVFKQPNVMRAAVDRVSEIASRKLREELLVELHRIMETESMSESAEGVLEEMRQALAKGCGNPSRNPLLNASGDPTAKGSQLRLGEWGVGNEEELDQDQKKTRAQDATGRAKATCKTKDGKQPCTHPDLSWSDKEIDLDPAWIAFWAAYPKSADKPPARKAWIKALCKEGVTPEILIRGAEMYRDDPTRKKDYTKNAATWLNAESWNNYDTDTVEPPQDPDAFWLN